MYNKKIQSQSLVKNAFINVLGQNLPLVVAFFVIPILIKNLGNERFGLLTIVWMLIGYCSLFDFGLGRALTKIVAERLGKNELQDMEQLIWTSVSLMFIIGILVATILAVCNSYIAIHFLHIPPDLGDEAIQSIYIMALTIPVVITTAGFIGVLQAYQRFDILNSIRVPLGALSYIGPCAGFLFSKSLVVVVAITAAVRLLNWLLHVWYCYKVVPNFGKITIKPTLLFPLLKIGGWMTVSNIISPLMLYFDRIILSGMVPVGTLAFYSTPYEMITKFLQIPLAIVNVLFPVFSIANSADNKQAQLLFWNSLKAIYILSFPILFTVVAFSYEAVSLWINLEFAQNSFRVLQILAIGVFINGLAFIPATLLQGVGRPDLNAKLHMLEFPAYLMILYALVGNWGIVGAAFAWVIRVCIDFIMLLTLSSRILQTGSSDMSNATISVALSVISMLLLLVVDKPIERLIFYLLVMFCFGLYLRKVLKSSEGLSAFSRLKAICS